MEKEAFPEFELQALQGFLYRIIESQEVVATRSLVSDLAKQELLESLLESYSKPSPPIFPSGRHYLFSTPFRYPPLKYGSRFGTRLEPSLFYGGLAPSTVLAECAYYRFVFWQDMNPPPPKAIEAQHTLFCAAYQSQRGVLLNASPFGELQDKLCHPSDYSYTQSMGAHLRERGVGCFLYTSARDPERGTNIGIFDPEVLQGDSPRSTSDWSSRTDESSVEFYSIRSRERAKFQKVQFSSAEGDLPRPA